MKEDLEIAGLYGWQSFEFTQAINEPAASFSVDSSASPANTLSDEIRQQEMTVKANGDLLITGFVDSYSANGDPYGGRKVSLSGRSKTADIIDSQTTGTFKNLNGKQIIERLISDFGVSLETDITDWKTHQQLVIPSGSTVMEAVYHALQLQQARASVSRKGNLQIWNADRATNTGAVAVGGGIESYSVTYNDAERFSEFTAKAQDASFFTGKQASEIIGEAQDGTIRHRTRLIYPRGDMDTPKAREAAEREKKRSLEQGFSVNLEVTGWRSSDGEFYEPNKKLFVEIPAENIATELIIKNVSLRQDADSGTTASLTLTSKEALEAGDSAPQAASAPKGSGSVKAPGTKSSGVQTEGATTGSFKPGIFSEIF